jgi:hypothetical protein
VVKLPQKNNLTTVCTSTFLVNNTGYGARVSTSGWEDDRTGSSKIFSTRKIIGGLADFDFLIVPMIMSTC